MLSDYIVNKSYRESMTNLFNFRYHTMRLTVNLMYRISKNDRGYDYEDEWWFSDIRDMSLYGRDNFSYAVNDTNMKINLKSYKRLQKMQKGRRISSYGRG